MSFIEGLLLREVAAFVLATVRIGGILIVAPLSWAFVPMRIRAALAVLLALTAHGGAATPKDLPLDVIGLALSAGSEFVIGVAMGFVVRLAIAIAEIAAEAIGPMMGLGMAQIFDPSQSGSQTVLAKMFKHFAILLALIAGVHRVVLGSVIHSFRVVPVGSVMHVEATAPALLALSAEAMAAGMRIAIVVVGILLMTQLALAFISRAAPAMQIFSVGFAVTLGVGFLVLILSAPDMAQRLLAELGRTQSGLELTLSTLIAK